MPHPLPYPRRYSGLARFVLPAQPRAEIWRSLAGLVLMAAIYGGVVFGALGLVWLLRGVVPFASVLAQMARAGSPMGVVMVLATFVPLALGVLAVTRWLHKRPVASLFGAGAARDFGRVFLPLLALSLCLAPLAAFDPHLGKATPVSVVLAWLPIALPLLFIQIAAEELVFRGYLLQQIAARSAKPLWWMVLPAALFGALHYAPSENGGAAIFLALWAMGFGVLAADLTARAGNLGPALAFHFANNISAIFLVGLYGQLDGLALFTLVINTRDIAAMAPYLALDCMAMVVFWLAARLMLRR